MKEKDRIKTIKEEEKIIIARKQQKKIKELENINLFFKKTLNNTLSAFFLSLISTIVNFSCNIPLLRKVSKESYGIVKVHFELAFTLINFMPRETIRRASQKFCPDKDPEKEKEKYITVSQINYLFFFGFSIISIIAFFCFMLFTDSERLHQNYIQLIVYIVCGLLELIIEPVVMYMNLHMENKFLPIAISSISRVIANTIFVAIFKMDLWGFTLSRIIGSTIYISYIFSLGYFKYKLNFYNFIPKDIKSLIFGKSTNNGINVIYLREILFQFIKLNLLNLILSRCQNVVLSFVIKSSDEEKSDYSFISQNYGLITRFLLEPIIDAFYNLVNKIKHIEKKQENIIKEEVIITQESQENNNNNSNIDNIDSKMEPKELEQNNIAKNITDESVKENIEKNQNSEVSKEAKKKINYELAIKLLQLFLKIFTFIALLIIPYYILIGTEIMGLIYGRKWQTNTIDKIGDCYSYYVIISATSDLVKNFGNATNDTRQMNLSYLSLIINAFILSLFMFFLSKWDICGLIIANIFSCIFLINCNLYIVFCGKNIKKYLNILIENSLFSDINNFLKKCFITKNSMIATAISIVIGNIIKKIFLINTSIIIIKILCISFVAFVNVSFLYIFDYKIFMNDLNIIKLY